MSACEQVLADKLAQAVARFRDIGATTVVEAINVFDMPRFLVHSLEDMQRLVAAALGQGLIGNGLARQGVGCQASPGLQMLWNANALECKCCGSDFSPTLSSNPAPSSD
ncbi:MAG: hypothetical protein ACOY41_12560 [Pseudomonadota bacterium]